jgi:hypothetical protein
MDFSSVIHRTNGTKEAETEKEHTGQIQMKLAACHKPDW